MLVLIIFTGCSGGGFPVIPDETSSQTTLKPASNVPYLLGLYDITFDVRNEIVEVVPNRTAEVLFNIVPLLQPPFTGNKIGVEFLDFSTFATTGRVDVRLTITHPLWQPQFRIFDVRGVFMGDWSIIDSYNESIRYPGPEEYRILNADGYTRWMNGAEFTTPGVLGFMPGIIGSAGYIPSATINGYKYFADLIDPEESVYDYFSESMGIVANRGSLTAGASASRDYHMVFPIDPPKILYQYAVLAGWDVPSSGMPYPAPSDFPLSVNTYEPIGLDIVDSSTLYMESPAKKGGNIDLRLNIIDWWAYWDAPNLSDYISKIIVSSETIGLPGGSHIEFDFSTLDQYATSAGNAEAVEIFIPDVEPSDIEGQEILIAIEMDGYDYSNPAGVPNAAENDPLTAYFLHTFIVSPEFNDPPVVISGISGDADVFIMDEATYTVNVTDEDSPVLTYEWTLTEPLTEDLLYGPVPGDGEGSWTANWAEIDTPGTVRMDCVVSDEENFVMAESLLVHVDNRIFYADLNDTTTGDNAGWTSTGAVGTSTWTVTVDDDNILQGFGYKFGLHNVPYQMFSADILVTPDISIPTSVDRAIAVIFHSFSWEYFDSVGVGLGGGNFRITQSPAIPTYDDDYADILAGIDYEGWLFEVYISDQEAFWSDLHKDELVVSALEIPPAFLGSDVNLSFAVDTGEYNFDGNHGWLIDDVQVIAIPENGNAPPVSGSPVSGDELVIMLPEYPGHYEIIGYDLEGDPLSYAWTVRHPVSGDIVAGPWVIGGSNEIDIDFSAIGIPGDLEVHVSITDGNNPSVAAVPLAVTVMDVIFHANFSDTETGDNAGWTETNQSGVTHWTSGVGSDSFLNGFGYKWGPFNEAYQENSQAILVSPPISIPAGITTASIYIRHDFDFLSTLDGGNFKVTFGAAMPAFSSDEEKIDGGVNYDVLLNGTVMDGQDSFGVPPVSITGHLSRMDLKNTLYGQTIRIGIAVGSGTTYFGRRGWLIDDVTIAIIP